MSYRCNCEVITHFGHDFHNVDIREFQFRFAGFYIGREFKDRLPLNSLFKQHGLTAVVVLHHYITPSPIKGRRRTCDYTMCRHGKRLRWSGG